jgi:hypothetical protein
VLATAYRRNPVAKASFNLPDGTSIHVDGTADEVRELLTHFASRKGTPTKGHVPRKRTRAAGPSAPRGGEGSPAVDILAIVNMIKTCPEAEAIAANVLDKRDRTNRILLPLYVVAEYMNDGFRLTSGEIAKITAQLKVPVHPNNVSTELGGKSSRFVMGNRTRTSGVPVRYGITRTGLQRIKSVLKGATVGDEE